MTFPDKIMSNEEWDRRHDGHELVHRTDRFPLVGAAVKRISIKECTDCDERHLYKMDVVFECPHCKGEMEEDGPHCKKCEKRPTCSSCKKRRNRLKLVPGTKTQLCGQCYRRIYGN
jgi:transposase-like protein